MNHPRRAKGRFVNLYIIPMVLILALGSLLLWSGCDPFMLTHGEPIPGQVCEYAFLSTADGLSIPCTVYLPTGYDPSKTYPMWVELHALNGIPVINNNPGHPLSNDLKNLANQKGWILIAPWGRNMHSLFMDGIAKEGAPYNEPNILDDFSQGKASWQPLSGTWEATNGVYRQKNTSSSWNESLRQGSTGKEYCLRVKVRDVSAGGTARGVAINLRRNVANNDAYRIELLKDAAGTQSIRLLKIAGGTTTELLNKPQDWGPAPGSTFTNIKFSCYDNYLELDINNGTINLQAYEADWLTYGFGRDVPAPFLASGLVSLGTFGGVFEFDEVRVQNEYEYGERDTLDCIYGAMEKYRIDPKKVYLMGHSQGGSGTWIIGLHHPDLCGALRPGDGFTDTYYDYRWFKDWYPENAPAPYAPINDGRMAEIIENIAGGPIAPEYPDRMSVLNGNSARYILENAINNFWRINHGTPDNNVPNSHEPVTIQWSVPFLWWWTLAPAPPPYTTATATYANGKDIYDILSAWSARGGYNATYITDPNLGHGFLEPYVDTVNYFMDKSANRRPSEVAFKTYDDVNTKAWWLQLKIPHPGTNEPGMARVMANAASNAAAIHARNLTWLALDLGWMGLDNGAGKMVSLTVDDNTAPNVFNIADTTGAVALDLKAPWVQPSGYVVRLDGNVLTMGQDYTISGPSLLIKNLAVAGGHTLTIESPLTLPGNLAPNPGLETASGAQPANWSGEVQGGGTASFSWDDLEAHGGLRSVRIKGANPSAAGSRSVWKSGTFNVSQGQQYMLSAFNRARTFRGGDIGLGIVWYNALKQPMSVSWLDSGIGSDYALNRDWTPLSMQATAPPGSAYAAIIAGFEAPSAGQTMGSLWFDDFSFTQM